jgi:hypothetical protein
MSAVTGDTGFLIGLERAKPRAVALFAAARHRSLLLSIPVLRPSGPTHYSCQLSDNESEPEARGQSDRAWDPLKRSQWAASGETPRFQPT